MKENKNQKPKHLKILKFVGLAMVLAGIGLLVASFVIKVPAMGENGWFESNSKVLMLRFFGIGLFMTSIFVFFIAFRPEITKSMIKTNMNIQKEIAPEMIKATKDIQEESKEDLTDIANTSADISSAAITKTARAIKKGLKDTKFCKHCGAEIDANSKFCSSCGKEQ